MDTSSLYLTAFLVVGGIIFLILFFHYVPFFLWLSAKVSGVNISLVQLFLMRIRNVPPYVIVPGLIEAHKAGLSNITRDGLEAHYLAGGHVEKVVHALVSAAKANIDLPFQMATAIDLAGRDVFEAVQMSVNPKVIDTPPVWHPAHRQGARDGSCQHPPAGGWRRRRHGTGSCRRRHRFVHRLERKPQVRAREPRLHLEARAPQGA